MTMIRVGIIGCDSTHTENYAAILNRDIAGNGMRATRLWGVDAKQARAKATATGIDIVTDSIEAAMEDVDAVMVESLVAFKRAGADAILTYAAPTIARNL